MYFRPSFDTTDAFIATDIDPVNILSVQYDIIHTYSFVYHGRKSLDIHNKTGIEFPDVVVQVTVVVIMDVGVSTDSSGQIKGILSQVGYVGVW